MLNPKFTYFSPATATHPLAEHVDHAIIALDGRAPLGGGIQLEKLESPGQDAATLRVDLWVNDLDDTTCTYGFLVSSENGRTPYARGERTVVSKGWSPDLRHVHQELRKDLPAYA